LLLRSKLLHTPWLLVLAMAGASCSAASLWHVQPQHNVADAVPQHNVAEAVSQAVSKLANSTLPLPL
jgi:hypothetical protein